MAIKFNVREYASNANTPDVYVQRNFDQINLMVHLFEGLTFKTIFEAKMVDLLPGLIVRAEQARDDYLLRLLEWNIIDTTARRIVGILKGGHALSDKTLMDFFVNDFSTHTDVFDLFHQIEKAGVDLPFLHQTAVQKRMAREDVFGENASADLGSLLNNDSDPVKAGIGNLTEYDLYTRRYIDYYADLKKRRVCKIIQVAKQAGVLQGQVPGGTNQVSPTGQAVTASKINNMACRDNVCVAYTGLYCVMTGAPPSCSVDSDPYPEG